MHPVAVGSFASFRVSVMTAPIFSFTAPSFTASSLDANGLDVYHVLPRFYQSSFDHRIYKRLRAATEYSTRCQMACFQPSGLILSQDLRRCMDEAGTIGTMAVSHQSDFLVPMAAHHSP